MRHPAVESDHRTHAITSGLPTTPPGTGINGHASGAEDKTYSNVARQFSNTPTSARTRSAAFTPLT